MAPCLVAAAPNGLMTRWGRAVDPAHVLPEYPRPQMVRKEWLNLNGRWLFESHRLGRSIPAQAETILVPFSAGSQLGGAGLVGELVMKYTRQFEVPKSWQGKHILLHFGAVDWRSNVSVNGKSFPVHEGGYDPFELDISAALKTTGPQTLEVDVADATAGFQPRGKQAVIEPRGIWYSATSGIWQTVWLEPVPEKHLEDVTITPDIDTGTVEFRVKGGAAKVSVELPGGGRLEGQTNSDGTAKLAIPHERLWSPDDPYLYSASVDLGTDRVQTYFGMRKIAVGKDASGITRLFLNNKPQFMIGPLDQGFWPDGLYTAPSDDALKSDIEMAKDLGFNLIRKHVKVEPERWYYWCDKLGMLVWQDMPSAFWETEPDRPKNDFGKEVFERELKALVETHRNHPSIVMWVLFNEGWGQYDTERLTKWLKELDPTRLVNSATGWTDKHVGDVVDIHAYPGPKSPKPEPGRAAVLGEFGGLGLPMPGHLWSSKGWSYQGYGSRGELTRAQVDLLDRLQPLIDNGLCAAVYTQTTDVETELNGLLTYDREILKPDKVLFRAAVRRLLSP